MHVLALLLALPPFAWPAGRRAAVVLTYDDALRSQLEVAVAQLDAAGLKGTFFLQGDRVGPAEEARWREAGRHGHELGNHTMHHPCPAGMVPGQGHTVDTYDAAALLKEIAAMNDRLALIDGPRTRTLSYPCSQTLVGGGRDYVDALRRSGVIAYARTGGDPHTSVVADPRGLDLLRVPSNGPIDHPGGAQLVAWAERVRAAGGLGVLQFHGVGGDYLEVSAEAHQELVAFLRAHPDIWVAPFQEVMDYVARQRAAPAAPGTAPR